MAANTQPIFTIVPKIGIAQVSEANANRNGTGTVITVITGATYGTRLNRIEIQATGTTTAGMIRLFISNGTNTRLWKETVVSAITPSAAVAAFSASIVPSNSVIS